MISGALELSIGKAAWAFRAGDFFSIEPFDVHSFLFLEDTTLVSMYSDGVEMPDGTKDIYASEAE